MKQFFLVSFLSFYCFTLFSQTNVSGTINTSVTWNLAGSPYVLDGDVIVAENVTLAIVAGVEVQFPSQWRNLMQMEL